MSRYLVRVLKLQEGNEALVGPHFVVTEGHALPVSAVVGDVMVEADGDDLRAIIEGALHVATG